MKQSRLVERKKSRNKKRTAPETAAPHIGEADLQKPLELKEGNHAAEHGTVPASEPSAESPVEPEAVPAPDPPEPPPPFVEEHLVQVEAEFPQPEGKYNTAADWAETAIGTVPGAEFIPLFYHPEVRFRQGKTLGEGDYFPAREHPQHPVSVSVIPNGRAWGKYGFVLTEDNRLLMEVSADIVEDAQHAVFHRWESYPLMRTDEKVAVLTLNYSENYYHWMYDILARLAWLEQSGAAIDRYIVNRNGQKPFQEETLQLLGLPPERRIETDERFHLQASRLIVPSHTWRSDNPKCAFDFIRRSFLPLRDRSFASAERIYISRAGSVRRLLNEEQILLFLEKYGFQVFRLETMTVRQQIQLFAGARAIVAPHGAGLTNLTFCSPGTTVIELFADSYIPEYFWTISNYAELDYYYLLGASYSGPGSRQAKEDDMLIAPDLLLALLERAGLT
ncbi:glycosyltransferase family 61 protein [Paenibacillus sp. y28]